MMFYEEPFIETWSGRHFHFMVPRPQEVCILDIAYALSRTVRWGGHCDPSISVAQHCVMVSDLLKLVMAKPEVRLQGLLHDAAEAYIPDIPTPIKPFLSDFKGIEARLDEAILGRFGIPGKMDPAVKSMDTESMRWEYRDLMSGDAIERTVFAHPTLEVWTPEVAELNFLLEFDRLIFSVFYGPFGKGRDPTVELKQRKEDG